MNFKELCELVTAIDQSDIAELTLKNDEFELTLRKAAALRSEIVPSAASNSVTTASIEPATPALSSAVASTPAEPTTPSTPSIDASLVEITSPMVGTFYRSPAPDESAFVEVGDRIQSGQTVCIIEAMKLMNELEAEVSGEVVAILVDNAEPIEFGQPLMRVKPAK